MANIVSYVLDLKDNLSAGIQGATHHVKEMESGLQEMGNIGKEVIGALGISFALFKGFEFVHEGVEAFEKLHQAETQLENTMQNVGTYSEDAFEKIIASSKELASQTKFSTSDYVELNSQLGLLGNIGSDQLQKLTLASANYVTAFGGDLQSAGTMIAKAFDDPMMAKKLEMKIHIDPGVKAKIKELTEAHKEAEARALLLEAIEGKIGDKAKEAFNADPLAHFNKMMGSAKIAVGDYATSILKDLIPALESFGNFIKGTIAFVKEHSDGLTEIAKGLGAIAAVYLTYKTYIEGAIALEKLSVFWKGVSTTASEVLLGWDMARAEGLGVVAAAQWALNLAMDANPIGVLIAGIVALIAILYGLYEGIKHCWEHIGWFRGGVMAAWEAIKGFGEMIKTVFIVYLETVGHILHGIWLMLTGEFSKGWDEMKNSFSEGGKKLVDTARNVGTNVAAAYKQGVTEIAQKDKFIEDEKAKIEALNDLVSKGKISANAYKNAIGHLTDDMTGGVAHKLIDDEGSKKLMSLVKPLKENKGGGKLDGEGDAPKETKTKAQGSKSVNIHIAISGGLVHEMKIMTTNISQSYSKIKDQVGEALVTAINDSQLVGGE